MPRLHDCFCCGVFFIEQDAVQAGVTPELAKLYCSSECQEHDKESIEADKMPPEEQIPVQIDRINTSGGFSLKIPAK